MLKERVFKIENLSSLAVAKNATLKYKPEIPRCHKCGEPLRQKSLISVCSSCITDDEAWAVAQKYQEKVYGF